MLSPTSANYHDQGDANQHDREANLQARKSNNDTGNECLEDKRSRPRSKAKWG